jgi:hypothetical protein
MARSVRRAALLVLLFVLAGMFVRWMSRRTPRLERSPDYDSTTPLPAAAAAAPEALTSAPAPPSLDNCAYVHRLLQGKDPLASSSGLPQSGKPTDFGAVFWLKQPVLTTLDAQSQTKVVLLKYNHYTPTQHTIKFTNTIQVLQEFRSAAIFPALRAFCRGAEDGFDYVLVDYVPLHPSELPAPGKFEDCASRAEKVLRLLVTLDEELHLAFVDVKPGQWMAREGGNEFVLQDMDDIVHPPWFGEQYGDQVEDAIRRVGSVNKLSIGDARNAWRKEMFPNDKLTIRYAMVRLDQMLLHDMGFRWEGSSCQRGMPAMYSSCLRKAIDWGAVVGNDWPSPAMVLKALEQCRHGVTFDKAAQGKRPRAAWRGDA